MIVTVIVALLNALGAILPQLPQFIAELRGHPELNDGGKAALEIVSARLDTDEKAIDAVQPLPTPPGIPDPPPTAPGR